MIDKAEFDKVIGFFNYAEVYNVVGDRLKAGDEFVEIGSLVGKSIIYLASRIKPGVKLSCVDLFNGHPYAKEHGFPKEYHDGLLPIFERNLAKFGVVLHRVYRMPSVEAAKLYDDGSLAGVFIDAEHSYPSVRADIQAWLPKVRVGGFLCGHDYLTSPDGVKRAVTELLPGHTGKGPCWWYEKAGNNGKVEDKCEPRL